MSAEAAACPAALPAFSGVGIEIEYMIVHRESLDPQPLADELLRVAAGNYGSEADRGEMGWSNELARHLIEIKNQRPWADLPALAAAFQGEVRAADAWLEPLGARLMPGSMHPWFDPGEAQLWHRDRAELYQAYHRIFNCRRHGWANIQAVHVNLPFGNALEFARLHAAVRLVLPLLPALAASSPIADGRAAGSLDHRLAVYSTHQIRVPATMGAVIPDESASPADYEARVLQPMYRAVAPFDAAGLLQHEWLNARAAIPRFDRQAIEIRVLDVQECPQADLAIAAATVALVRRLYEAGAAWLERHGKMGTDALVRLFQACLRDADGTRLDDPAYLAIFGLPGPSCTAREAWARLVDELAEEGRLEAEFLPPLRFILERGPLARRLLKAVGPDLSRPRLQAVYGELCRCLQDGKMFLA